MAKYMITHSCGHAQEHQLVGSYNNRESKSDWLATQPCTNCWRKEKNEAEAKKPIIAQVSLIVDTLEDGTPLAQIALTGGTIKRKDDIKALGYQWGEIRGGVMSMLSMSRPTMAWHKIIPIRCEHYRDLQSAINALSGIAERVENKIDVLTLDYVRRRVADAKSENEIAPIPKPVKPTCHPSNRGRWNGKYYGNDKYGYRVYVDGTEVYITADEVKILKDYQEAMRKYNDQINNIRGERSEK